MIRKFHETDTGEVLEIYYHSSSLAHAFLEPEFIKKEKDHIREIYLPQTKTWVFEGDNGLDGFISMIGNEVGGIFVRPEKIGQGIGKMLMDFVSGQYKELEVEVFEENVIGKTFYEKYGFKLMKEYIHEETNHKMLRMKFKK